MKGAWKTNETFERDRCLWLWVCDSDYNHYNDLLGAELQTAAGQKIISKVIDADGDPARSYADGDRHLPLLQVDARHLLFRTQPIPSERRRTKVKPNKWLLIANLIAEILLAIKVLTMG